MAQATTKTTDADFDERLDRIADRTAEITATVEDAIRRIDARQN